MLCPFEITGCIFIGFLYNSINSLNKKCKGIILLKLYGKLVRQGKNIKDAWAEPSNPSGNFHDQLEECLIQVCKKLDVEVPLWLKKNTTDFGLYRKTSFNRDHFGEDIAFDRLEIQLYS